MFWFQTVYCGLHLIDQYDTETIYKLILSITTHKKMYAANYLIFCELKKNTCSRSFVLSADAKSSFASRQIYCIIQVVHHTASNAFYHNIFHNSSFKLIQQLEEIFAHVYDVLVILTCMQKTLLVDFLSIFLLETEWNQFLNRCRNYFLMYSVTKFSSFQCMIF